MNKEEIIEGNELIVSFLGWTKYSYNQKYDLTHCRDYDCYNIGEFSKYSDIYIPESGNLPAAHYNLEFHSSWDWLMPVVEKIEKLQYTCDICSTHLHKNMVSIGTISGKQCVRVIEDLKIKAVWTAVIEFIKWYNTQNNE
ncbi:MAG: hypothetical protein M0R03_23535 [Novosphingobium sp.]|nr:hypothetical protein [Novosphingobium sp.]